MKTDEEKMAVIKQLKKLENRELIHAIKGMVEYGLKVQSEQSMYNISEAHKKMVRRRIKSTKKEEYLDWDKVSDKLKA